jgi:hypothetical protein
MPAFHRIVAVPVVAAAGTLALAVVAPAADAPAPEPVVRLSAGVVPGRLPIPNGTPLTLTVDTRLSSEPTGGNFVVQRAEYLFGRGARFNWRLFPTCSAARLQAARGRLSACPRGSRIGSGFGVGTAVSVGVTSRAAITLFNGPGRRITMNVVVVNPALINETIAVPITRLRGGGRYTMKLSSTLPEEFKTILDGDIVLSRLVFTTGATRMVNGVRRGLFEAKDCPRGGSPIRADFVFDRGRTASDELTVVC